MRNGFHRTITLNFMIAGHTKFAVDWGFGLVKKRFRRTRCNTLNDIKRVIEDSSSINHAVLVGDESGNLHVPTYDWSSFLLHCSKFPQLKEHHYFRFEAGNPDHIFARKFHDEDKQKAIYYQQ